MFERIRTDEDRGQVGIGTLIVFIAMVLVAAIAAGVLVNTAGFLQATAEDAGQESVNKVTNRVEVINAHGVIQNNTIQDISLTVRLAAGSNNVDMDDVTIKYLSDGTATTLTNDSSQSTSATNFMTTATKDEDGSLGVLNTPDDRFNVTINASEVEGRAGTVAGSTTNPSPNVNTQDESWTGLDTGATVTLDITSRTGGTTTVILTMPEELAGKSNGEPVGL